MSTLISEARVATSSGKEYLKLLCNRLAETEIETFPTEAGARAELPRGLGTAFLEASPHELLMRAEAGTEQGLSALKFLLGLRLEQVAEAEKPDLVWTGHGCDLTVLPGLREMRVKGVRQVTPLIRRITLGGEDLGRFDAAAMHVRLLFPPAGLDRPEWPVPGRNGRPVWPPQERCPTQRIYTIRSIDVAAGELDIDFVLHGDEGVASGWAARASVGDLIGMLGPGGAERDDADWYLLAGDETAIPAIARILQRLPAHARGVVLVEVADAQEIQPLAVPPGLDQRWLLREDRHAGHSDLLADAVTAVKPPEQGTILCWLGAEAETARRVRHHWREVLELPREAVISVAYWHREKPAK
jgi:NADPH-dependent ferric siderophore reductase